tara:strand:- start:660 stop:785 length:126 start_codon:yes stop_codon:yes gene_type:complete
LFLIEGVDPIMKNKTKIIKDLKTLPFLRIVGSSKRKINKLK